MASVSPPGHREPQKRAPHAEAHVVSLNEQPGRSPGGKRDHREYGQVGSDPPLLLEGVNAVDPSTGRVFVIRLERYGWKTTWETSSAYSTLIPTSETGQSLVQML